MSEVQHALVDHGEIVLNPRNGGPITTFQLAPDDRGEWLPVENVDSAPLDPAKHWRLAPLPLRVDGKRVIREFPIVVKSLEHA